MPQLKIDVEGTVLSGELFRSEAPESVEALREILPLEDKLQHVRWSGYATWVNLENTGLIDVPRENHTIYPSRGDVLLYPGFKNDKELLIACGSTCFKSPAGEQAGNHIATLDAALETLRDVEETTLTDGQFNVEVRMTE